VHHARHGTPVLDVMARRLTIVTRRLMTMIVVGRICQDRNQHGADSRSGQHRNHDVAVGSRGMAGHDEATDKQANL